MIEVERTLVKSPPELWELVDDETMMSRWAQELADGADPMEVEVSDREDGSRLAWRGIGDGDGDAIAVELEIAERGWGTGVSIRASGGRQRPDAGAVLERLLDELGSANRRPFSRG